MDESNALVEKLLAEHDASYECWRYEQFLQTFPLNRQTVIDYFRYSNFYDKNCSNEYLRMQQISPMEVRNKIKQHRGVEYEVDTELSRDEHFFIIRKQFRENPERTRLLALYCVIGRSGGSREGTVYPLPTVQDVFVHNLLTATYFVNQGFAELATLLDVEDEGDAGDEDEVEDGDDEDVEMGGPEAASEAAPAASDDASAVVDSEMRAVVSSTIADVFEDELHLAGG